MLSRDSVSSFFTPPVFAPGAVVDSTGAGAGDTAGAVAGVASREMPKRPLQICCFQIGDSQKLYSWFQYVIVCRNDVLDVLPGHHLKHSTSQAPWEAELVPEANGSKVSWRSMPKEDAIMQSIVTKQSLMDIQQSHVIPVFIHVPHSL